LTPLQVHKLMISRYLAIDDDSLALMKLIIDVTEVRYEHYDDISTCDSGTTTSMSRQCEG
jgi:hypothetical protein